MVTGQNFYFDPTSVDRIWVFSKNFVLKFKEEGSNFMPTRFGA